ncbi:MAG: hypothetical protein L0228_00305 [Planctomycetes bacterium]|nr:hypothetical protein [Planctomycetota bacterium]
MGGFYYLGILIIGMGIAGFTKRGLPFTSKKRITGRPGQIIGAVCIAFGLVLAFIAFWFAPPAARSNLLFLSCGMVIGALVTWLAGRGLWP